MRFASLLSLLLLLPLAGCGLFGPTGNTPQAECERQANQDPKVVDLTMKQFATTPSGQDYRPDIAVARHEALQRCLLARGLIAPGGVEPVRPRY
jgi:predicted small lipoprotein YifL